MGWDLAGPYGMVAGFTWGCLNNLQRGLTWYKKPWGHAIGMAGGYVICKTAASWEDYALAKIIAKYERRGFVLPEEQRKLFEPEQYKTVR